MSDAGAAGERSRAESGWRVRVLVLVGVLLLRLLASTWRFRVRNDGGLRRLRAERRPFIFAFWHRSLLALAYWHRREDIVVLVSEHRDGELIARTLEAWGYRTIRGSTTRGASRALLAMIRELEGGSVVGITPDGPRGPATVFQPGALIAAQRARAPIVPIVLTADRAWRLNSWDRFIVPKPFARITVVYGDPTMVRGATPREASEEARQFETMLSAGSDGSGG